MDFQWKKLRKWNQEKMIMYLCLVCKAEDLLNLAKALF